jgi:hypothetical protein
MKIKDKLSFKGVYHGVVSKLKVKTKKPCVIYQTIESVMEYSDEKEPLIENYTEAFRFNQGKKKNEDTDTISIHPNNRINNSGSRITTFTTWLSEGTTTKVLKQQGFTIGGAVGAVHLYSKAGIMTPPANATKRVMNFSWDNTGKLTSLSAVKKAKGTDLTIKIIMLPVSTVRVPPKISYLDAVRKIFPNFTINAK